MSDNRELRMFGGPSDGQSYAMSPGAVQLMVPDLRGGAYVYSLAKDDRGADVLVCEGVQPIRKPFR